MDSFALTCFIIKLRWLALLFYKGRLHFFIESTNDVGSLFALPVVAINTRCTYRCITVRAYGLVLKAALIHMHNGIALVRKAIKLTVTRHSFN